MDSTKMTQAFDVEIKSPMGWIRILASIELESENAFHGKAKLMGFSNDFDGGEIEGNNYRFDIQVKLPFGMLKVHIDANVDEDGTVTGEALVPKRKPMQIRGHRTA